MPTSVYVIVGGIAGLTVGGIGVYVWNSVFNDSHHSRNNTTNNSEAQYIEIKTKSDFDIENKYQSPTDITDHEEEVCEDDQSCVSYATSSVNSRSNMNLQRMFEKETKIPLKEIKLQQKEKEGSVSSTKVQPTLSLKTPTKAVPTTRAKTPPSTRPRTPTNVRPSNSTISSNSSGSPMREVQLEEASDGLAKDIDYFIRHKKDFSAPNYQYSVKQLAQHIKVPKELNRMTLAAFLRSRPEFVLHSNKQSFSLAFLTPFRTENVKLFGRFQCSNVRCKTAWCSNDSYADMFQNCPRCKTRIYPYEQAVLSSVSARDLAACEESKREAQVRAEGVDYSSIYGLDDDQQVTYYQNETRFAEV